LNLIVQSNNDINCQNYSIIQHPGFKLHLEWAVHAA